MRETCYRCFWPKSLCCVSDPDADGYADTVYLSLMSPKEFKVTKANTGRLTHLCLQNSELHMGMEFDHHVAVQKTLNDPQNYCVLLYPGKTATDLLTQRKFPLWVRKSTNVVSWSF